MRFLSHHGLKGLKLSSYITSLMASLASLSFLPSVASMASCTASLCSEKLCAICHRPFQPPSQRALLPAHSVQLFLCEHCTALVPPAEGDYCMLCGHGLAQEHSISVDKPISSISPIFPISRDRRCLQCQASPPPWDKLSFYAPYEFLLKHCILRYKYSVNISLVPVLNAFLYAASLSLPPCDILIPMPRHQKRLASQGFNHMLELALTLHTWLDIPLNARALWRTRYTVPQVTLPRAQRKTNPRESFAAQEVQGKRVLLLDDVMTTGATLYHASKTLRTAGATHIAVLVVARAE